MIKGMAIFAAAAMSLFGLAANASTISIYDDAATNTDLRGTLTCSVGCEVLISEPGTYSAVKGQVFTVHPPNDATELAFVNANLTGGDTPYLTGNKNESPGTSFTSSALYILFKIGNGNTFNAFLVHNTGGNQLFTWAGNTASGLSHTNSFGGTVSPVPLPAAGFLLVAALGGLALVRRRKATI